MDKTQFFDAYIASFTILVLFSSLYKVFFFPRTFMSRPPNATDGATGASQNGRILGASVIVNPYSQDVRTVGPEKEGRREGDSP